MARQGFTFLLSVVAIHIIVVLGDDCSRRYYQHYEQKRCRIVLRYSNCPARFDCKELSEEDRKTCINRGKIYKDREVIQELGPCDSCSCEVDRHGSASIECASVDCPDWEPQNASCYMGYKPGTCCPVEMCPAENKELLNACQYNGKEYRIGDFIETLNPCQSCICTKEWNGDELWSSEYGPGCSTVNCILGIYADKIRSGCLPLYHEKRCCPLGMYCDGIYGVTPADVGEKDKKDYCHYQGRYYERGSVAYLKDQCVTCKCTTPPDFTCVRKACPPPPRNDCKAVYGQCCPKYVCP